MKKTYTLREALQTVDFGAVYSYIYNKDNETTKKVEFKTVESQYNPVVKELLELPKVKPSSKPILVKVTKGWEGDLYTDVCLLNKSYVKPTKGLKPYGAKKGKKIPKGCYNVNLSKYNQYFSISFTPWSEIIDTPIINKTKLPLVSVIGEILWELTFYGWNQKENKKKKEDIIESIDKVKEEIKAGKVTKIKKTSKNGLDIVIPDSVMKVFKDYNKKTGETDLPDYT